MCRVAHPLREGPETAAELEPEAPEPDEASRLPVVDPEASVARVTYALADPFGAPAGGANVALRREGRLLLEGTTGENGEIVCEEGGEGDSELLVLARRSAPQILEVSLEPGLHEVHLERGAVVSGWVLVDGARPSELIPLVLRADTPLLHGRKEAAGDWGGLGVEVRDATSVRCRSESDGSFLFYGLPDDWRGSIDLPRDYRLVDQTQAVGHWDAHRLLLVEPRVDVVVDAVKLIRLTGRVIDFRKRDPQGVARAWVEPNLVYPETIVRQQFQLGTMADETGRFELALRSPTILGGTLTLQSPDREIRREIEIEPMSLTGDHDLGDLALSDRESTITIPLRVLEIDGSPISGAIAGTDSSSPISAPTDEAGRTTLSAVVAGLSSIAVYAAGFEPAEVVVPVELPEELVVTLRRGTLLKIQFEKPGGEAASSVVARLWAPEHPYSSDAHIRSYHAYTGAGCSYYQTYDDVEGGVVVRLYTLREGRVTLNDLKPGLPFELRVDGVFGTVVHLEEIAPLQPGEQRSLVVELPRGPATLHGRVLDHEGRPLSEARASVSYEHSDMPSNQSNSRSHGVDAEGRFTFENVYAARVSFSVRAEGYVGFRDTELEVPQDGSEIVLHLDPAPHTVTVRIEDESGQPLSASSVRVELATGALVFGREVDDDPGAYILHDLPDEEVTILAYVFGVPYRQTHHPADPELVIRVPATGEVEVRLHVPADVELDDKTLVCLVPAADSGLQERYAWIVEGGAEPTTFPGVIPGRYEAVVRRYPDGYEFMDRFEELGPRVSVVVTAKQTARIELWP